MKYFLATEFRERPYTMELISLGLVAEDGRELYAVSSEFNESTANNWEKANVLPYLGDVPRYTLSEIREQLLDFLDDDNNPEFIGWQCAYDWVLFGWLFGDKDQRPYSPYCYDIQQAFDRLHIRVTAEYRVEFNALQRAKWVHDCYTTLANCQRKILITKPLQELIEQKLAYFFDSVFTVEDCGKIAINTPGFDHKGSMAYRERLGKYLHERVIRSIERYQKEKKAGG